MTRTAVQVGCGAAIVRDDQLLLVRRRREPEAGCWGLPGGKVDLFEAVRDAVVCELREELGIGIDPDEILCVAELIDRTGGQHWVAPVFRIRRYEGVPAIMEPDALSGLGWFEFDDLPAPRTRATVQAVAAMRQLREG